MKSSSFSAKNQAEIQLALGAICISFAPILVRLLDVPPTAVGFYRCGLAAAGLLPFYVWSFFRRQRGRARGHLLLAAAGLIFALDLAVWHRSILYVGAGIATLLANTQVFYLGLIQMIFGEEKPTRRFWLSVCIGLLGVGLIAMARPTDFDPELYPIGVAMGLSTGLIYASYIATMGQIERKLGDINVYDKVFWVSGWAALFLCGIALFQGQDLAIDLREFTYLASLSVISQIAGWVLITRSLPMVTISHAGLIVLLQPIFATILGYAFLGETMNSMQWAGSIISLFAIYFGRTA